MERKEGRLWSHALAVGVGSVLSKLTVFLLLPLYTACLSPAAFGTVDVLINTAALIVPIVSLNAPETVFRFVAGGKSEGEVLAVGRLLLLLGTGVLLLLLPILSLIGALRPYLFLLVLYVVAAVLHSYYAHLLRARGQYVLYALQQLFCTLLMVALAFLFLPVLGLGESGYLLAILVADLLIALILLGYFKGDREEGAFAVEKKLLRSMLRYAVPLIPTATLWRIIAVFDRYVILWYHGEAEIGLYAAAGKIPSLLSFSASIFLEAWHYAAIHTREEGREQRFERIYRIFLPSLVVFTLALILGSHFLVEILFSESFSAARLYVPILSVAALFSALSSFLGSVYVVRLRTTSSLITALVGAVANLVLNFCFIPMLGAMGAAISTLCSYVIVFLWRSADCRRVMPFKQHFLSLTASVALLLATALLIHTATPPALLLGLLSLLPFWREIGDIIRLACGYGKKIWRKATKNVNKS